MKNQTRYKRKQVRGGSKQTLKNQKIIFTIFVGDDGLYLQEPKVERAMFASNLKKGTKLTKGKDFKGNIQTALTPLKKDYEIKEFDAVYSDTSSSAPKGSAAEKVSNIDNNSEEKDVNRDDERDGDDFVVEDDGIDSTDVTNGTPGTNPEGVEVATENKSLYNNIKNYTSKMKNGASSFWESVKNLTRKEKQE